MPPSMCLSSANPMYVVRFLINPHAYHLSAILKNETVLQANQSSPEQMESFEDSITRFNVEFTAALMQLLDQISELNRNTSDHEMLFNLLYRFVLSTVPAKYNSLVLHRVLALCPTSPPHF